MHIFFSENPSYRDTLLPCVIYFFIYFVPIPIFISVDLAKFFNFESLINCSDIIISSSTKLRSLGSSINFQYFLKHSQLHAIPLLLFSNIFWHFHFFPSYCLYVASLQTFQCFFFLLKVHFRFFTTLWKVSGYFIQSSV